jgi:penicillin-binding protein 1B
MTPFEVAQFYQTLAADGFHTPLRAINAVMAADRTTLSRYGWLVEQRFAPEIIFQLNHALQRVMSEGTGKAILDSPLGSHHPAGKTGTTDELRDSWFAGFSGEHLAVVWLGRDDNRPIALTGSSGALVVWINTLEAIHSTPLTLTEPAGISWGRIQARAHQSGSLLAGLNDTLLPFTAAGEVEQPPPSATGQRPAVRSRPPGSGSFFERLQNWLQ